MFLDSLITEWQRWCKLNNITCKSADEVFCENLELLTKEQKTYVLTFIKRWEEAEEKEHG